MIKDETPFDSLRNGVVGRTKLRVNPKPKMVRISSFLIFWKLWMFVYSCVRVISCFFFFFFFKLWMFVYSYAGHVMGLAIMVLHVQFFFSEFRAKKVWSYFKQPPLQGKKGCSSVGVEHVFFWAAYLRRKVNGADVEFLEQPPSEARQRVYLCCVWHVCVLYLAATLRRRPKNGAYICSSSTSSHPPKVKQKIVHLLCTIHSTCSVKQPPSEGKIKWCIYTCGAPQTTTLRRQREGWNEPSIRYIACVLPSSPTVRRQKKIRFKQLPSEEGTNKKCTPLRTVHSLCIRVFL